MDHTSIVKCDHGVNGIIFDSRDSSAMDAHQLRRSSNRRRNHGSHAGPPGKTKRTGMDADASHPLVDCDFRRGALQLDDEDVRRAPRLSRYFWH